MSDFPPQLGDIPHTSEFKVPTLNSEKADYPTISTTTNSVPTSNGTAANGSATTTDNVKSTLINAKDTVAASASQAANTIANHPITQNTVETISNAPVTQVAKDQTAKTSAEFDALKNSRKTTGTTVNDQPLTHYHSFFYTLLSWENPRVTGIAFALSVLSIFAFRYLPAGRWLFKIFYLVFGTVAAIETASKLVLGTGVAHQIRPRRYVTIPREALEASLEDVEQLINFFVIEFQRILYAENVLHTALAFFVSFVSYFLIKFVPTWGLLLIGDSLLFSVPLIYTTNKEAIDHYLNSANEVVGAQARQIRDIASTQTNQVAGTVKQYAGDYTAKAQELVGGKRSPSPQATYKTQDFPAAPKQAVFPNAPKQDPIVNEVQASVPSTL